MRVVEYLLRLIFNVLQVLIGSLALVALLFFVIIYFNNPKIALEFTNSCLSCKKPSIGIIGPQDANHDGRLTKDDWKILLTPTTSEPKVLPDPNPTEQQEIAIDRVNYYRSLVGLHSVSLNQTINSAAEAHAAYNVQNNSVRHDEDLALEGFTGVWPWDRLKHFGYNKYTYVTEVCSMRWASVNYLLRVDPVWAIDGWINTVYHRLPILSPLVYEAGFGSAKTESRLAYVMDFANPGLPTKKCIVYYPVNNQENIPVKFDGDEIPNPLPGKHYPVGYPITVTFSDCKNIKIEDIKLLDNNGENVDFYKLLPYSDRYINDSLAIIPVKPLKYGTVYTVAVRAYADGKMIDLTWQFKTASKTS
ncbi:MAG: CAP domain-containing protein [Actinomycetota bacterium]